MVNGAKYTRQSLRADFVVEPYTDNEKICKLTLSDIGDVFCTTVENDKVVTDVCPRLDFTAINLALTKGRHVLLQVEMAGETLVYQIFSVNNNNNGRYLIGRAIDSQPGRVVPGEFKGASVTVTMYDDDPCFTYWCFPYCNRWCDYHLWSFKDKKCEFVSIDSDSGELSFHHDTPISDVPELGFLGINSVVEIRAKRDGCKNAKTMIGIIVRVCDDGKRIKLRISKKGLKSKGCAAKKVVDGFKEGVYQLQSIQSVLDARSAHPPILGIANGVLKRTAEPGTVELAFNTTASSKLYEVDSATKIVSSKSVDAYLAEVAQSISEPVEEDLPGQENKFSVTMGVGAGAGAGIIRGFINKLSWTEWGYNATVHVPFSVYNMLGEKTNIENFSVNFVPSSFVGQQLIGQTLYNRVFPENTDFRFANLQGSTLQGSTLIGADFSNNAFLNFTDFRFANLTRANFTRATGNSIILERAILQDANLSNAQLIRANLQRANLQRANLDGAILQDANLQDANLSGAFNVLNANLTNATLIGVNFSRVNLTRTNFSGLDLSRAIFTNANLTGANFRGATLTGANFRSAILTGAIINRNSGGIF
jgi:uncharacterized protein YjbI with pentapeptide repeats